MCLEGPRRCIDPRVVCQWFIYIHSPASQKRSDLWDSGVMYGTKRLLLAIGALTLLERAGFMNCACAHASACLLSWWCLAGGFVPLRVVRLYSGRESRARRATRAVHSTLLRSAR